MKKWLLAGLLIGSFAFGKTIKEAIVLDLQI